MKAIDYDYACQVEILAETIKVWLDQSDLTWSARSKILTDWRNQKVLLNIPYDLRKLYPKHRPISRHEHQKSYLQAYVGKVLFKL